MEGKTVVGSSVEPGLGGRGARGAHQDGVKVTAGARTEVRLREIVEQLDSAEVVG